PHAGIGNPSCACALAGSLQQQLALFASQLAALLIEAGQLLKQRFATAQPDIAAQVAGLRVLGSVEDMQKSQRCRQPLAGPGGIVADGWGERGTVDTGHYV